MQDTSGDTPAGQRWTIDDIRFHDIDRDRVHDDRQMFFTLTAASFIEITVDVYAGNLATFYRGDDEVTDWLTRQWEPEESQHGTVLKRYVQTVWPEFDWEAAYRGFFAEYLRTCAIEQFAATPALEFASRCVVETGTATLYRAISEMTEEPVLKRIAALISADEVRHYKYFYRFFRRYGAAEGTGRLAVLNTLWRRMSKVDDEDGLIAFKHAFLGINPGAEFRLGDYKAFRANARRLSGRHYPYDMAVRMILKPLKLSPPVVRAIVPPARVAAQMLLMR